MIRAQRNRHWLMWLLLAALLPVGMVLAYTAIPQPPVPPVAKPSPPAGALVTAYTAQGSNIESIYAELQKTEDAYILEVDVLKPLSVPSAGVYQANGDQPGQFIGALHQRGLHQFELPATIDPADFLPLIIYDNIKAKVIYRLTEKR